MADNRLTEAVDVVARRIVAREWNEAANDIYLDDLDLSDEDARAVVAKARSIVLDGNPDDDVYEAACEYLGERAEAQP